MKNHITISTLSPELQKAIRKEVSALKIQAQKKPLSDEAIAFLETFVDGTWTQRKDGRIDVTGNVKLKQSPLVKMLGKEIFFGTVSGDFDGSRQELTSLEGAPEKVGGGFNCTFNKLTSLIGAPKKVGGSFYCKYNNLTSLEGAPEKVGEDFDCSNNELTSLEGAPKRIGRSFWCRDNKLTSLEGIGEVKGRIYK